MRPAAITMQFRQRLKGVSLFGCLACLLCLAQSSLAGECRDRLKPLLLASAPSPVHLAAARNLCVGAYDRGDPDAAYQLALLDLGLEVWRPARAIPLVKSAATAGVSEAQYWLAWQHEEGPLLPNDWAQALYWYQSAAEQEHRLALQRLADAYARGELGLKPDARLAMNMRSRAQRCAQK